MIITDDETIRGIAGRARRVAVLGIKTEKQALQPAFYVPEYLARAGVEIVPVPVYYPDVTEILGKPVVRSLTQVEGEIDVLDVFRRPEDLIAHEAEILALAPKVVWLQTGIRHDALAERFSAAGMDVVQDRCLMVEHRAARAAGLSA
ncbi:MAG: CoA-binding protein [Deltaproteobacteria bacterium]|nr:CoA-binding protein [Deltaproteobacteria bacterium]